MRYAYYVYILCATPFQYDAVKAAANLKTHSVSFAEAEGVFNDPLAVTAEDPDARGEQRFVTIGLGNSRNLLVVVYTERDGEVRLISARRATLKERKSYEA